MLIQLSTIYLKASLFITCTFCPLLDKQCTEMLKVKICSRSEHSFVTPCPGCCLGMREYTGPMFQCYQLCMHTRNQTFALGVSNSRLFSLNCSRGIALSKQSWKKKAFTTRKKLCFWAFVTATSFYLLIANGKPPSEQKEFKFSVSYLSTVLSQCTFQVSRYNLPSIFNNCWKKQIIRINLRS